MYLTIIFLTLISSLTVGFFGRWLGFNGSAILATSCVILAFFVSTFIFYEVAIIGCNSYIKLASWISSETLNVDWGFMFDSLTASYVYCCNIYLLFSSFIFN
jgi:NADH-ubiquinone oxidoreductase chain 5